MKRFIRLISIGIAVALFAGCAANFAGKTPVGKSDVRFITANEAISAENYEVKGVVVVQRSKMYFDFFGMVKPPNEALSEVFTEDIANELTGKVRELGGNAVLNMEVVQFSALPGGFLYLLPIGLADVTLQATAITITE